jgi:hypothetical protein
MRFARLPDLPTTAEDSFSACLAAILERDPGGLPALHPLRDPADIALANRWLGSRLLGVARIAEPTTFSWPGPWIALVRPPGGGARHVLMYGTPSGVIWDPAGDGAIDNGWIAEGYLIAAADPAAPAEEVAGDRPAAGAPRGIIETLLVAPGAQEPVNLPASVIARPGLGLAGDRYADSAGSFPTGVPGSALTLIEAEVCESFDPPLAPGDHRRNVVTRGIALNDLLGVEFELGEVRCRGMRLCEPCTVVQRYAGRPVLRALAHRGGLRADILSAGEIRLGDPLVPVATTGTDRG